MITLSKLRRFVKTRNKSAFASNLQFQIDAEASGFRLGDLGTAKKFLLDGITGYQWEVPTKEGTITMVEFGALYLKGDDASMFRLMEERPVVWCEPEPCPPASN